MAAPASASAVAAAALAADTDTTTKVGSAASPADVGGFHLTLIVIGKVQHSDARVLVEMLESGEVTATLTRTASGVRTLVPATPNGTPVQDGALHSPPAVNQTKDGAFPPSVSVTQAVVGGRPKIFKFSNLEPNAHYTVSFEGLAHEQPCSGFTTMMKEWKIGPDYPPMRVAAVSCNLLSETLALTKDQVDLWQDLADRVLRGELDYLLHMGDQVYADEPRSDSDRAAPVSAFAPGSHEAEGEGGHKLREKDQLVFAKCVRMLEKNGAATPEAYRALFPQIEEMYRILYRETWSHAPTAKVLANVPNLSVYDDHDFVDNWGTNPTHHDPNSKEFAIGLCARQIYFEYQAPLYRDVAREDVPSITDDHHFHVFGEYGFAFTESRGAQSFRYRGDAETAPFLGESQWVDVEAAMRPGGLFDGVRHLMFVCPCPVVYLPPELNAMIEPMVEDAQGHWAAKPFLPEQTRLLNLALEWQEGGPEAFRALVQALKDTEPPAKPEGVFEPVKERGAQRTSYPSIVGDSVKNPSSGVQVPNLCTFNRRLTFLGGDVHVGGHTRIFKHGHLVLEQLVSSAISNHVLPRIAFAIGQMIQNALTDLQDGWSFQHQPYTRMRNYGLVDSIFRAGDNKPQVVTHIVAAE